MPDSDGTGPRGSRMITLRVTEEERKLFKKTAALKGMSLQRWLWHVAMKEIERLINEN